MNKAINYYYNGKYYRLLVYRGNLLVKYENKYRYCSKIK